jgi:hypothetical protein
MYVVNFIMRMKQGSIFWTQDEKFVVHYIERFLYLSIKKISYEKYPVGIYCGTFETSS